MKLIAIAAALGLLCACATTPVASDSAPLVAGSSVIDANWLQPDPAKVRVTVTRDKGFLGAGCALRIDANRAPVATIQPGERIVIYVPVGQLVLQAQQIGAGLCSAGASVNGIREAAIEARAGEPIVLRVGFDGGGLNFSRTAF